MALLGTRSTIAWPFFGGAMPSYRPDATKVGQVMRPSRSLTSWPAARLQLRGLAGLALGRLLRAVPGGEEVGEAAVVGMVREPLRREARVEELEPLHRALVDRERVELVQRIGRGGRSARRRAEQREPFDPLGDRHRELLRDHAAEADADDSAGVPADHVEQRGGVGRVLGHGVRRRRDLGAAEPALVVRNDVAPFGERSDEHPGALRGSFPSR